MRWVAGVMVVMSACAKPGGGAPMPTPTASEAPAVAVTVASAPAPAVSIDTLPAEPAPALPSPRVQIGNGAVPSKPKLCEVVVDGLTVLRPCTGAAGEKPSGVTTRSSKLGNCLVMVGDLEIIRPCEGKPNERRAPTSKATARSPKMCERVEHTANGDIVTLRPCAP